MSDKNEYTRDQVEMRLLCEIEQSYIQQLRKVQKARIRAGIDHENLKVLLEKIQTRIEELVKQGIERVNPEQQSSGEDQQKKNKPKGDINGS